jgi:hypothetical protein
LCHKDPLGSIGFLVQNLLLLPWDLLRSCTSWSQSTISIPPELFCFSSSIH